MTVLVTCSVSQFYRAKGTSNVVFRDKSSVVSSACGFDD